MGIGKKSIIKLATNQKSVTLPYRDSAYINNDSSDAF